MLRKISLPFAAALMISNPALAQEAETTTTASTAASAEASGWIDLAQVQTYLDVVAQLEQRGYAIDSIERTLLGRMMIRARNKVHLRELVVSRHTGEVMHDTIVRVFEDSAENAETEGTTEGEESNGGLNLGVGADLGVEIGNGGTDDDSHGGVNVGIGAGGAVSIGK